MEYTGNYWQPIANVLYDAGIFVSIVNALLIYKYGNNSIRKGKTDKLDAVKIANYCLDRWTVLERYTPVDQIRQTLKTCRRQYDQYIRLKVNLKNNLIALLDGTFPGLNILFKSAPRDMDGHEKWVDFAEKFWHRGVYLQELRKSVQQANTKSGVPKPGTDLKRKRPRPSMLTPSHR